MSHTEVCMNQAPYLIVTVRCPTIGQQQQFPIIFVLFFLFKSRLLGLAAFHKHRKRRVPSCSWLLLPQPELDNPKRPFFHQHKKAADGRGALEKAPAADAGQRELQQQQEKQAAASLPQLPGHLRRRQRHSEARTGGERPRPWRKSFTRDIRGRGAGQSPRGIGGGATADQR